MNGHKYVCVTICRVWLFDSDIRMQDESLVVIRFDNAGGCEDGVRVVGVVLAATESCSS